MKLTDERIKKLIDEDRTVHMRLGSVTLALTQDSYKDIVDHIGDWKNKDWEMVGNDA